MEVRCRAPPPCSQLLAACQVWHASRASPCLLHSSRGPAADQGHGSHARVWEVPLDPRQRPPRCARPSGVQRASHIARRAERACVRCACPCLAAGCPVAGQAARCQRAPKRTGSIRTWELQSSANARSTTPPPLQRRKVMLPAFETWRKLPTGTVALHSVGLGSRGPKPTETQCTAGVAL